MPREAKPLALIAQAERHGRRTAVIDSAGAYTYESLLDASARVAAALLGGQGEASHDLNEERVAFLVSPGFPWVAVQWGIWRAGGVAVPLPIGCPPPELEYFIDDTGSRTLLFDSQAQPVLAPMAAARGVRALSCDGALTFAPMTLPEVASERRAMILYTSGTTNKAKGVVTTHDNIAAQITTLVSAWEWSADDHIVLCLPLHHVHGIINVLSCALWSGATCDMLPRFDANVIWDRVANGRVTVFMAVPTVYHKLIAAWEAASPERRATLSNACQRLRLMVSGSAALPVTTLERWHEISGHVLLERYGMTEIGMALSNPLHGTRVSGSVGTPLPGVQVRLVDDCGAEVASGAAGEIEVRGASVFKEYWGRRDETRAAFHDEWFRTGDVAVVENGVYRILGRKSIDIIKTGGHKVSALEIEEVLRGHPAIEECAVVGVADPEWGERVGVMVVLRQGNVLDVSTLRSWAKERLAPHKIPSLLLVAEALPRNSMGKVTKPAIGVLFRPS